MEIIRVKTPDLDLEKEKSRTEFKALDKSYSRGKERIEYKKETIL